VIRVILADDQIPANDSSKDERVCSEILREKGGKLKRSDFDEDHEWFKGLCKYLKQHGLDVVEVRHFEEAKRRLRNQDYDVAVIDLSWTGDYKLPPGERENVGLELLSLVNDDEDERYIPVIAFSQNFRDDYSLVDRVLERGALPVAKTYDELGHRVLEGSIRLITRFQPADAELRRLYREARIARQLFDRAFMVCLIAYVVMCLSIFLPGRQASDALVMSLAAGLGVGGAGILVWAWKRYADARSAVETARQPPP
jgi:PleD family two-component response regulator